MVAQPTTQPTIKPYHFLALAKAIAAADLDLAEDRKANGWRTGTDVHGWMVADELVALGYFERNIHGQSRRDDLNAQRYRITPAGRAAYLPDPAEAAILTKLQTALTAGHFGGWLYWQELVESGDWLPCDQLVGKGWIKPKTTPGKPQTRGIGNRAYRLEDEGSRVLAIFNQKEVEMSATTPSVRLDDNRYVDPDTGEILELADATPDDLTADELTTRAASAVSEVFDTDAPPDTETPANNVYVDRMAVVDPQIVIANLQTDLQKALREKYDAEREMNEAKKALELATKLPNPGEYRQLQQTVNDQRQEINRLTLRVNEAESNGWKGKHEKLLRSYQQLDEEVKALRQPDLEIGAKLATLTEERDLLKQQVDYLQSQLDTQPVIDAAPVIVTDFIIGAVSDALAKTIAEKEADGWQIAYRVIHADGSYYAEIKRQQSLSPNIEAALERALSNPRSDHIVEADQMVIIGLDNDSTAVELSGQPLTPVPTFAQITQALVNGDIDINQFDFFANAQARHSVEVQP